MSNSSAAHVSVHHSSKASHGPAPSPAIAAARDRFSSLRDGFVYLDAPGGTQTPDEVAAAVADVYLRSSGNTGAPYATGRRLEALVDEARAASARFYGCTFDEIIFGANMTSLNFTLTRTLGRQLAPGDEIVVTRLDHDGNVAPWLDLAADRQLRVLHADVHSDTSLDLADLERHLTERTKVVAFPWAANSTGTIVDAKAICDLAHEAGALAWVDAVQYAAHEPMDVQAIGADVVTCSSYKFCGPHLGIAFGRRDLLESWKPYKARPVPFDPVGHRFETGTLPYELLGGLLATYAYLDSLGGMAALAEWERQLGERMLAGFPPGTRLYGLPTMDGRLPVFLVNFAGVSTARLSEDLADLGFGVWNHGSYYALGLYERIGWGEALRIGIAHYNTIDEMDRFNEALTQLVTRAVTTTHQMVPGVVVQAARVPAIEVTGASVRTLVDTSSDEPGLIRRLVDLAPLAQVDGAAGAGGELWFVIEGTGRLMAGQADVELRPDRGFLLPPGCTYRASAGEGVSLRLDTVALPAEHGAAASTPLSRDFADCEVETTGDRQFRVLFGPGRDCAVATQFVGEIPPGRAPDHSHPYDEVVLVLAGQGIAHIGGAEHALAAGTCAHLPPGLVHCLENTGRETLRVLGVFHPADSPAAKLEGQH